MKKLVFIGMLIVSACLVPRLAFAQKGTIKGQIMEQKTKEPAIGMTVKVEGTDPLKGGATNYEGSFEIQKVPAGTYTLSISGVGFQTKKVEDVRVEADRSTSIKTIMEEKSPEELEEVTVTARRETNTQVAVVTDIKKSETVATGISAEQIKKTQDRNAAQVMKRTTGVSINDSRFVMIRGLSTRYNAVMLNNVLAPSFETNSRAFAFDIVPSSIIDRMMINKGGYARLPGEYAGGVIQIDTKNIPDYNETNVSLTGSFRSTTTLQGFRYQPRSNSDFLGYDGGLRSLPEDFPTANRLNNSGAVAQQAAEELPNTWRYNSTTALPDLSAKVELKRKLDWGNVDIGNVTMLRYSHSKKFLEATRDRVEGFNRNDPGRYNFTFEFDDERYQEKTSLGAIHNWGFVFSPNFKLDFKNLLNQQGKSESNFRTGKENQNNQFVRMNQYRYRSRSLYSGQLIPKVFLGDWFEGTFTSGYSYTRAHQPDNRQIEFIGRDPDTDFIFASKAIPSLQNGGRFFSDMNEHTFSENIDLQFTLNPQEDRQKYRIETGAYLEHKKRDFQARWVSYGDSRGGPSTQVKLQPLDRLFQDENLDTANGFRLREGTTPADAYDADYTIAAPYLSTFLPVVDSVLSFNAGLRMQYFAQNLNSAAKDDGSPIVVANEDYALLPSANFTL